MSKHPNKEIQSAIEYAKSKAFTVEQGGSHCWGQMYCPAERTHLDCQGGAHCITSILSTPKNPENHAKRLRKIVDRCIFFGSSKDEGNNNDEKREK